jgi:hypothetical protein
MKTFIISTVVLLLTSIILSVVVFWYVQSSLGQNKKELKEIVEREQTETVVGNVEESDFESIVPVEEEPMPEETPETAPVAVAEDEPAGIPLRDLPLSDTQKSLIEGIGIDVATYEISPATITCAENALGAERFSEIVEGSSPSGFEMLRLTPCL